MLEVLKIELTSRCNANCIFCDRKKAASGDMDLHLFKSIVEEFPEVKEVQPQFFGESLLHPRFIDAIKYLKENNKKVVFYTNGSLLSGQMAEELADLAPSRVIFSVESDTKESYGKLRRGLNWETTLTNIENFQRLKKPETLTTVRMTITEENHKNIERIARFWSQRVDNVAKSPEIPRGREVKGIFSYKKCLRPWQQLVVKWNGDVVLCCIDWHGDYVIGNVSEGARNVWLGDSFNKVRYLINKGPLPELCKQCGFYFSPAGCSTEVEF